MRTSVFRSYMQYAGAALAAMLVWAGTAGAQEVNVTITDADGTRLADCYFEHHPDRWNCNATVANSVDEIIIIADGLMPGVTVTISNGTETVGVGTPLSVDVGTNWMYIVLKQGTYDQYNYTLNVRREEPRHTVTFDPKGGGTVSAQNIEQGNKASRPNAPTPPDEDMFFVGWYLDDDVWNEKWNFDTDIVTEPITLYARWASDWDCSHPENPNGARSVTAALSGGVLTISGTGAMADYVSVNDIPWYEYRTSITEVDIKEGVTSIGNYAFGGTGITTLDIPGSVTFIGNDAFANVNITSISVDDGSQNYILGEDGVLFDKDQTRLLLYPRGKTEASYTIPNSVTVIGNYAFSNNSYLTSVTIPEGVTSIGDNAFFGVNLTSIVIPNSVTTIGAGAFGKNSHETSSLKSVVIGNGVTSIGNNAFKLYGACEPMPWDPASPIPERAVVYSMSITPPSIQSFSGYNEGAFYYYDCFYGSYKADLYVPAEARTSYLSAWSYYFAGINELPSYTVTFISNGTEISSVTIEQDGDGKLAEPTDPTPADFGEFFDGWYKDAEFVSKWDFDNDIVTEDMTLYAKWNIVKYSVSVVSGGTGKTGSGDFGEGATVNIDAGTAPAGKVFLRWTSAPAVTFEDENSAVTSFTMPDGAVTVTAEFIDYQVVVDNGDISSAKGVFESAAFTSGLVADRPINSKSEAKEYVETYVEAFIADLVQQMLPQSAPLSLVAGASAFGFAYAPPANDLDGVTYEINDGVFKVPISGTKENTSGTPGSYTFTVTLSKGMGDPQTTDEMTLVIPAAPYTQVIINSYDVTWNVDGGTPVPTQISADQGSNIAAPATMSKAGYTFGGWYDNAQFSGSAVTFPISDVTGAKTFWAKWVIKTYAVTLPTGGVGYTVTARSGSESPVDHGGSYSFKIAIADGYSGSGVVVMANDITLTADADGVYTIGNIMSEQVVAVEGVTSIASHDRNVPAIPNNNGAVVVPMVASSFELSIGPNPVQKSDGALKIFASGKAFASGTLTVYDATGNVVRKINIKDNNDSRDNNDKRRIVGVWDLTDDKGRAVSNGAYLVRGTIKTVDGKREKVSAIISVR